jgi:hypothetical protein
MSLADIYRPLAGPLKGQFDHHDIVFLNAGTAGNNLYIAATATQTNIATYEFWTHTATQTALRQHVYAEWVEYSVCITPLAGLFGRALTLHYAWGHDGMPAPNSVAEMVTYCNYRVHTFGGAANYSEADLLIQAPFNEARTSIMKLRNFPIGGRIVFYCCYTEGHFGVTQVNDVRMSLHFQGKYNCYGHN